jgi:hypothetical protein
MDLVVDEELFVIETISSRTQFLMNKPPKRPIHTMVPAADERHSEDVAMEFFNKRHYTFTLTRRLDFFIYFLVSV